MEKVTYVSRGVRGDMHGVQARTLSVAILCIQYSTLAGPNGQSAVLSAQKRYFVHTVQHFGRSERPKCYTVCTK